VEGRRSREEAKADRSAAGGRGRGEQNPEENEGGGEDFPWPVQVKTTTEKESKTQRCTVRINSVVKCEERGTRHAIDRRLGKRIGKGGMHGSERRKGGGCRLIASSFVVCGFCF